MISARRPTSLNNAKVALLAVLVSFALSGPAQAIATDAEDGGLLVTGSPPAKSDYGRPGNRRESIRLETDACGFPELLQGARTLYNRTGLGEQEDDGLEGFEDLGPADQAWVLVSRSLSVHPNIAVIVDGVGRSCADDPFADENFDPDTMAAWRGHAPGERDRESPTARGQSSYIA